jgi:hypothetical protein
MNSMDCAELFAEGGFVAQIRRIAHDVLKGIVEARFDPGDLSCLSSIIRRDAVTFFDKGIE